MSKTVKYIFILVKSVKNQHDCVENSQTLFSSGRDCRNITSLCRKQSSKIFCQLSQSNHCQFVSSRTKQSTLVSKTVKYIFILVKSVKNQHDCVENSQPPFSSGRDCRNITRLCRKQSSKIFCQLSQSNHCQFVSSRSKHSTFVSKTVKYLFILVKSVKNQHDCVENSQTLFSSGRDCRNITSLCRKQSSKIFCELSQSNHCQFVSSRPKQSTLVSKTVKYIFILVKSVKNQHDCVENSQPPFSSGRDCRNITRLCRKQSSKIFCQLSQSNHCQFVSSRPKHSTLVSKTVKYIFILVESAKTKHACVENSRTHFSFGRVYRNMARLCRKQSNTIFLWSIRLKHSQFVSSRSKHKKTSTRLIKQMSRSFKIHFSNIEPLPEHYRNFTRNTLKTV